MLHFVVYCDEDGGVLVRSSPFVHYYPASMVDDAIDDIRSLLAGVDVRDLLSDHDESARVSGSALDGREPYSSGELDMLCAGYGPWGPDHFMASRHEWANHFLARLSKRPFVRGDR